MNNLDNMSELELGMLFPVAITEYCPGWPLSFLSEKRRLEEVLKYIPELTIDHIGSTAIPWMAAKPIIDILIQIGKDTNTESLIRTICNEGYHYIPQPGKPSPHMMFVKGYTPNGFHGQAFHVHVRFFGDWDELYFKQYLVKHPEAAREYEELKRKLVLQYKNYREKYAEAKIDFIQQVCKKPQNPARR